MRNCANKNKNKNKNEIKGIIYNTKATLEQKIFNMTI